MTIPNPHRTWRSYPIGIWVEAVVFFALMPCFAVLYLIFLPVIVRDIVRDRLFRRRLRQVDRLLGWQEVKDRLTAGKGTLIVALAPKGLGEAWWTEVDLRQAHPDCPLPTIEAVLASYPEGYKRVSHSAALAWCEAVLPTLGERACLTDIPKRERRHWDHGLSPDRVRAVGWLCMGGLLAATTDPRVVEITKRGGGTV